MILCPKCSEQLWISVEHHNATDKNGEVFWVVAYGCKACNALLGVGSAPDLRNEDVIFKTSEIVADDIARASEDIKGAVDNLWTKILLNPKV
jgi:hypothetical protein